MTSLRLAVGDKYKGKASSNFKTVASSFGLLAVLLRQLNPEKSPLQKDGTYDRLKQFVNKLDLSSILIEEKNMSGRYHKKYKSFKWFKQNRVGLVIASK